MDGDGCLVSVAARLSDGYGTVVVGVWFADCDTAVVRMGESAADIAAAVEAAAAVYLPAGLYLDSDRLDTDCVAARGVAVTDPRVAVVVAPAAGGGDVCAVRPVPVTSVRVVPAPVVWAEV